jgi:crotonobetainyl-CoA:carnitine CoA-transferase CaiB-like acyl-CoA transferase
VSAENRGALRGLRVLDLSRVLAGPYACMMLGDHGADVIKVEPPGGDETRAYGPPFTGGEAAYYLALNRNKRSIVLDLATPQGQEVVRRLVQTADVLVENFKSGTVERWGLDYAALAVLNPRLIYCSISGFGRSGPYAHMAGYDAMVQAMAGMMSLNGEPDGAPVKAGIPIADLSTGIFAFSSILLALQHRATTGLGQRVEVSLLESMVALLHPGHTNYLNSGLVPKRMGNSHPNISPYDLVPTADRPIYLAVGNDRIFARFAAIIGRPELITDPRFDSNPNRVINRAELLPLIVERMTSRGATAWCADFWAAGIPAGPVNSLAEVFTDPQVQHRQMRQTIPHPTAGTYEAVGIPIKLDESPGSIRHAPPLLGEHTEAILSEIGFSSSEIARMLTSGVAMQGGAQV